MIIYLFIYLYLFFEAGKMIFVDFFLKKKEANKYKMYFWN